jgi:nucleolar pre-ribosomal-associated protein 1
MYKITASILGGSLECSTMENLAVDALSPLVIPVLAQFAAKLEGKLLAPSDALAIAAFARRLAFKLAGEQRLGISAYHLWEKANAMMPKKLYSQYACVTAAIRREVPFQSFHRGA